MPGIAGGKLFIGEDSVVFWGDRHNRGTGLYDSNLGSYVNDATVTFVLKDSGGNFVGSGSGNCSYVTDTNGVYEGVLEDGVALTEGGVYYLEVTATASSDRIGFRRLRYTAQYHGAE